MRFILQRINRRFNPPSCQKYIKLNYNLLSLLVAVLVLTIMIVQIIIILAEIA